MSIARVENPARERHWVCARRMRDRRLALGLTQREVAARLITRGNQVSNRSLSAMENGRGVDLGLVPDLADALRCSVTYLLGLTRDPSSWLPEYLANAHPVRPPNGRQSNDRPHRIETPPAAAPSAPSGVLGPHLPHGFAAPGRSRNGAAPTSPA
jgi:transcriptional regulator with XRE-family HTH domain